MQARGKAAAVIGATRRMFSSTLPVPRISNHFKELFVAPC